MLDSKTSKSGFIFLLNILIVLGIFSRFYNLDHKAYWVDEVINSHYAAGYSEAQIARQVQAWNGQIIEPKDLLEFQFPNSEQPISNIIQALAIEEPQSPPLHYMLTHFWTSIFGNSIAVKRSLPACFSAVAVLLVFQLCLMLFQSKTVGHIAAAIFSVSPIHLVYAQEARYYAAWIALSLLSILILEHSIRHKNPVLWLSHCLVNVIALYTYPFTLLVMLAQGIYVATLRFLKSGRFYVGYLLSSSISLILYSPWLHIAATTSSEMSKWRQREVSRFELVAGWLKNLEMGFWDLNKLAVEFWQIRPRLLDLSLKLFILFLFVYSIYFLCKYFRAKSVVVLIISLTAIPWIAMLIPDLWSGGVRSLVVRYLLPSYVGIQIMMAYMFARNIEDARFSLVRRKIWLAMLAGLLTMGVISSLYYHSQEVWWSKGRNVDDPAIAAIINASNNPLVVSRMTGKGGRELISLAYALDEDVRLQLLYSEADIDNIDCSFNDVYLYHLPSDLRASFEAKEVPLEASYLGRKRSLYKISCPAK